MLLYEDMFMSNDVDFEQFIQLLDAALASDDKNVRQALRKFMFVAAMVLGDDTEPGPFTQMMETIDALQRRVALLEGTGQNHTYTTPNYPGTTSAPIWYGSGTGTGTSTSGTINIQGGSSTTNAYSTTTTASTTGNITLSGTTGYSIPSMTNTVPGTTTTFFYDIADPKSGTKAKNKIAEGLKKLATTV